jgi:methylmalonyl-CoA/ethylmalonyl-CoA epimerase
VLGNRGIERSCRSALTAYGEILSIGNYFQEVAAMSATATITTTGLYQVLQNATDLDRAVAFYQDVLGLRLLGKFNPPGLALFDAGGPRIMLSTEGNHNGVIYLRVDDLHQTVEDLRAKGVAIESEPHVIYKDANGQIHPAGTEEWMAFFRDSEDNLVGLASTVMPE